MPRLWRQRHSSAAPSGFFVIAAHLVPALPCHACLCHSWKQSCPTASHLSAPSTGLMQVSTGAGGPSAIVPRAMAMAAAQMTPAQAAAVLAAYTKANPSERATVIAQVAAQPTAAASAMPTQAQPATAAAAAPPAAPAINPALQSPPDLHCTLCHRLFNVSSTNTQNSLPLCPAGRLSLCAPALCLCLLTCLSLSPDFLFRFAFSSASDGGSLLFHLLLRRMHPTGAHRK